MSSTSHDVFQLVLYRKEVNLKMLDANDASLNCLRRAGLTNPLEEKDFDSLDDLLTFFEEEGDRLGLIFRGQSDASWELNSSLVRLYKACGFSRDDEVGIPNLDGSYDARLDELFSAILQNTEDMSLDQKLLFAQHYGFPSRLLDWTENLDVALFFAFEQIPETAKTVALYCVDVGRCYLSEYVDKEKVSEWITNLIIDPYVLDSSALFEKLNAIESPDVLEWLIKRNMDSRFDHWMFMRPKSFWDLRMSAQKTVVGIQAVNAPFKSGNLGLSYPYCMCFKACLPASLRSDVMSYLESKGVTRSSLFPDADKLRRDASENLKLEVKRVIKDCL